MIIPRPYSFTHYCVLDKIKDLEEFKQLKTITLKVPTKLKTKRIRLNGDDVIETIMYKMSLVGKELVSEEGEFFLEMTKDWRRRVIYLEDVENIKKSYVVCLVIFPFANDLVNRGYKHLDTYYIYHKEKNYICYGPKCDIFSENTDMITKYEIYKNYTAKSEFIMSLNEVNFL